MCKQAKNPPFSCRFPTQAMPISVNYYCNSPKNAKADLPTFVEVWVETHRAVSCGHQTHSGWRYWVVMGEAYKEVKEPSLIWSVKWSSEQSMNLKRKWKLSGWNTSTLQLHFSQREWEREDTSQLQNSSLFPFTSSFLYYVNNHWNVIQSILMMWQVAVKVNDLTEVGR